jgi:uncharacterized damage-inducible protein DinB
MGTQTQRRTQEIERIHSMLKSSFSGDAWHGDSLMKIVDGITAERAAARPIPGAHSIWELVQHIAVWEDVVRRRLNGETVLPTPQEDWAPVPTTDAGAWKKLLEKLTSTHAALEKTVADMSDDRLDEIVPAKQYNVYTMLHGIIQHDVYHAGQIVMVRKALR